MADLLVTVVTPSLNQGRYIEATIKSVLNQTYKNIEYIIMDGGSTDGTYSTVKNYQYDKRLKYIYGKDKGQYDAINKGFLQARGNICGWINADDIYDRSAISKIVSLFDSSPDIDVIYGRTKAFRIRTDDSSFMYCRNFSIKWLRRYCYVNPSATFLKSSIMQKERIIVDNDVFTFGDWDWFLNLAKAKKKFYYLPDVLGYFRIHDKSRIYLMTKRQIFEERKVLAIRHQIPINYMKIWIDYMIPWLERFENIKYMISNHEWKRLYLRIRRNINIIK